MRISRKQLFSGVAIGCVVSSLMALMVHYDQMSIPPWMYVLCAFVWAQTYWFFIDKGARSKKR